MIAMDNWLWSYGYSLVAWIYFSDDEQMLVLESDENPMKPRYWTDDGLLGPTLMRIWIERSALYALADIPDLDRFFRVGLVGYLGGFMMVLAQSRNGTPLTWIRSNGSSVVSRIITRDS